MIDARTRRLVARLLVVVGVLPVMLVLALVEPYGLLVATSVGTAALDALSDAALFAFAVTGALVAGVGVALCGELDAAHVTPTIEPTPPGFHEELAHREAEALARLAEPAPSYELVAEGAAPDDAEITRAVRAAKLSARAFAARAARPLGAFVAAAVFHAALLVAARGAAAPDPAVVYQSAAVAMQVTLDTWHDTTKAELEEAAAREEASLAAGFKYWRGGRFGGGSAGTVLERFRCLNELEQMWPQYGCGSLFFGSKLRPWHRRDTRWIDQPTKLEDARLRAELGFDPPPCTEFDQVACSYATSVESLRGIGELDANAWRAPPPFPPPLEPGVAHAPTFRFERLPATADADLLSRGFRRASGGLRACLTRQALEVGGALPIWLLVGVDGGLSLSVNGASTLPDDVKRCALAVLSSAAPVDAGQRVVSGQMTLVVAPRK